MTTSIPRSTGTFHFSRGTGTWTWSEQVYAIYGFAPGAVLPTTQLILAHQHPEDRAEVEQVLADAFETGTPHTLWHRIRDAHGNTRQVVMLGAGDFADDGALVGFSGILVDLMISYGLDADGAFRLLRSYSQRTNVKLRDVARNVVEALVDRDLPLGSRATWDELAAELSDHTSEEERSG